MACVGIDFGCLNAVVAQAERGGIKVLLNENSKRLNANMVSFQGKQRFLGEAAASIARSNYKNTVSCLKRLIGCRFDEATEEMARLPGVRFCEVDGRVGVEVMYDEGTAKLSIPQCAAMMMGKLSQICAAQEKGVEMADVVMSIPAWFSHAQRLATLDACEIAGIKCLRLMHDTTATALEYGIWRSMQKMFDEAGSRVMFCDLGYSSFQVSVVEYVPGKLTVKATTFDRNLGGRDFDLAIAKYVAAEFKKKYGDDPLSSPKPKMKLLDACEKAKKTLSPHGVGEANLYIECLMNDIDYSIKLTLEKFEELVQPLLDRLEFPVLEALAISKTDPASLSTVEIVGGATRVASVKRKLASVLNLSAGPPSFGLKTTLNADEAVSKGCAMQAAMLSPRFKVKEYVVCEAVPFSVKVSWGPPDEVPMDTATDDAGPDAEEGLHEVTAGQTDAVIFAMNSDTPRSQRLAVSTKVTDFRLEASYVESNLLPAGSNHIGYYDISGLTAAVKPGGKPRVRIEFNHSLHGTLSVVQAYVVQKTEEDAKDEQPESEENKRKRTKTALTVEEHVPRMSRKALDEAVEVEARMANSDRIVQETNDMRNELEAYIYKMRDDVISVLRPYVTDDKKTAFEAALADAENWLYDGDGYDSTKSAYAARLASLKTLGDPIAKRYTEETSRPTAVKALQQKLEDLRTWCNSGAPPHITDDDKSTVRMEVNVAQSWLMDKLHAQGPLGPTDDPVLEVADIKGKIAQLDKAVKPILNKPKPKPAPAKDEPKEAKETAAPAPADDKKDDKSDVEMPDAPPSDAKQSDAAEPPPMDDVPMPDADKSDAPPA